MKLEFKSIAPGGPDGYVFTDAEGNEHISDIPEKVNAVFEQYDASVKCVTDELVQANEFINKIQAIFTDIVSMLGGS